MRLTALAFTILVSFASSVVAAQPAYVGTWGNSAAQCAVPQEQQGAPMVFSKGGYDQHEAHCTFEKMAGESADWKVSAVCVVEGDKQPIDFSLAVKGDTLTMSDEFGKQVLTRCK